MGLGPTVTQLPCGQCIGCRLERSQAWATRCVNHAQLFRNNAFITLTYAPEKLLSPSLRHRDFQLFMKRLRKCVSGSSNKIQSDPDLITQIKTISYYMAGEYGEQHRRPHFHACLFNCQFNDKKYWKKTATGSRLYTSETLDQLWGHGFTSIGEVNHESAAYIARYIIAKKTGPGAWKYYEHLDPETGEITDLKPEYNKMSLRPAIGKQWLENYTADVYPHGTIQVKNKTLKTPKYYDKKYKKQELKKYEQMKKQRAIKALQYRNDNTPSRLATKERVKRAQLNQLLRSI